MEISGLDGAITMRVGVAQRFDDLAGAPCAVLGPDDVDGRDRDAVVVAHEVLLEVQSARAPCRTSWRRHVIGDRQERERARPVTGAEFLAVTCDLGGALAQSLGAIEVRGEVAVAESKPGVAARGRRVLP